MKTEELVQALVSDLRPVRRLRGPETRALLWAALAVGVVALGSWLLGPRADLLEKHLAETGVLLALFVQGARSAFRLGVPGLERSALPIVGLAAWLALVAARLAGEPRPLALDGLGCVATILVLALVPAAAALRMLRRSAPLAPGWAAAYALLSAAALATVGVQALCANDGAAHVLAFHVLPVAAVALLGAAAGRRAL